MAHSIKAHAGWWMMSAGFGTLTLALLPAVVTVLSGSIWIEKERWPLFWAACALLIGVSGLLLWRSAKRAGTATPLGSPSLNDVALGLFCGGGAFIVLAFSWPDELLRACLTCMTICIAYIHGAWGASRLKLSPSFRALYILSHALRTIGLVVLISMVLMGVALLVVNNESLAWFVIGAFFTAINPSFSGSHFGLLPFLLMHSLWIGLLLYALWSVLERRSAKTGASAA